jgi:hypothetical protein
VLMKHNTGPSARSWTLGEAMLQCVFKVAGAAEP